MNLEIVLATPNDATSISQLAEQIWWPTYDRILSAEQIKFMLLDMYSPEALERAMNRGQEFYLALLDGDPVGFVALREKENAILRIEKIYLLPPCQGKGIGNKLIRFTVNLAGERGFSRLELNVNRGNPAYKFYQRQGFAIIKEVDIHYFSFILDDYVMQKKLIS